jgi:uroporphyrinogen-III synthase
MTTIIVTRPDGEADPLVAALRQQHPSVRAVPTVSRESSLDTGPLDDALAGLLRDDWLVVTSAAGVAAVGERLVAMDPARRARWPIEAPRIAAIGPGTAAAVRKAGLGTPVVAASATTAALLDAIGSAGDLQGRRVVLARADAASPDLPAALRTRGAIVVDVVAYRTVEAPAASRGPLVENLSCTDPILVLASESAVRGLLGLLEGSSAVELIAGVPVVTIGPRTTEAAWEAGLRVVAEATEPTIDGLVAAVAAAIASRHGALEVQDPAGEGFAATGAG